MDLLHLKRRIIIISRRGGRVKGRGEGGEGENKNILILIVTFLGGGR